MSDDKTWTATHHAVAAGVLVVFALTMTYAVIHAQPKTRWYVTECFTNTCIEKTLNDLDTEVADSAKITTWRNTTYVWYRGRAER